jgi:hypothetical protein
LVEDRRERVSVEVASHRDEPCSGIALLVDDLIIVEPELCAECRRDRVVIVSGIEVIEVRLVVQEHDTAVISELGKCIEFTLGERL